jgi:hypothetical protein
MRSRTSRALARLHERYRGTKSLECFRWTAGGAEDVEIIDYH